MTQGQDRAGTRLSRAELDLVLERALADHREDRTEAAIDGYRVVLAHHPDQLDALMNMGTAMAALGYHDEACRYFGRARALAPGAAAVHRDAAAGYAEVSEWREALDAAEQAARVDPTDGLARAIAGHVHLENGRRTEAQTALRKAVALSPDLASGWFSLHLALFDDRDPTLALPAAERAVALEPSKLWYRWALGTLRWIAGDDAGARADFAHLGVEKGTYRGAVDAWAYVREQRTPSLRFFATTRDMLLFALDAARPDGIVAEFGVRHGSSVRWLASKVKDHVHGFDSFEGLPEKWHDRSAGAYSTRGQLPKVPTNVKLHVGWFADTLPGFTASHPGPLRLANVDCDLYSSTVTVLDAFGDRVGPGTVFVFDEYIVNDRWREDEFKAFQEAVAKRGWKYEYLAFSFVTMQAVARIV